MTRDVQKLRNAVHRLRTRPSLLEKTGGWVDCPCQTPGCGGRVRVTSAMARQYRLTRQDRPTHCATCLEKRRQQ